MKRLNTKEIRRMAKFLAMTEQEAKEVAEIFADIYEKEQGGKSGWRINLPLNDVEDYIEEWENHWHRETNWQEYYSYEKECCFSDYNEAWEVFQTIENFKEYNKTFNIAYELSNGLIIIVC